MEERDTQTDTNNKLNGRRKKNGAWLYFIVELYRLVAGRTDRAHQWVEDADGEGSTTSERLRHVQLRVRVVVVVLV